MRKTLDRKLVSGGFAGYEALSAWIEEQGFEISKSALHRYGQDFEERLGALKLATEQARAIVAESGDDEGAVNEALIRLLQERLFGVLMDLNMEGEVAQKNLPEILSKISRAIADVGRASVQQKKFRQEVQARAKATAEEAVATVKRAGLSDEAAEQIKKSILGIAA